MWSKQISPEGKTYYFNHITYESSWDMPEEIAALEGPKEEIVVECKLIPQTEWRICLTNFDHEFFYNQNTKFKSWDIPEEILEIVGGLLQDAMSEDEEEDSIEEDNAIIPEPIQIHAEKRGTSHNSDIVEYKRLKIEEETDLHEFEEVAMGEIEEPSLEMSDRIQKSEEEIEKDFIAALEDNKLSPFSTWAIESDKFKHDVRIIAIADNKKRKQLFERWCVEKSQKIIAEQSTKQIDSKTGFLALMKEQIVNPKLRYDDFCRRFKKDVRFMKFEDIRERQTLFDRHITQLKDAVKAEARRNFQQLLEESNLNQFSTWIETQRILENDPRFLALKNPIDRENQFRMFIKGLRNLKNP